MSDWQKNKGRCPVDYHTRVDVRFNSGEETHGHEADVWTWGSKKSPFIIAWRLHKEQRAKG